MKASHRSVSLSLSLLLAAATIAGAQNPVEHPKYPPPPHEAQAPAVEKNLTVFDTLDFVYAPDISIKVHPIRFGSGGFTAASGVMTGTFSRPMPVAGGKPIPPTGKRFAITMLTVGHWVNGKMDHEWLFWDNHDFMKQIGLAK